MGKLPVCVDGQLIDLVKKINNSINLKENTLAISREKKYIKLVFSRTE